MTEAEKNDALGLTSFEGKWLLLAAAAWCVLTLSINGFVIAPLLKHWLPAG